MAEMFEVHHEEDILGSGSHFHKKSAAKASVVLKGWR
jgi:hypothetical protein